MHLYLIEHGETEQESTNPDRPLTAKGKHDIEKIAHYLTKIKVAADDIWHSPKLRSKQTAEIIAEKLGIKSLKQQEFLKPNDATREIVKQINRVDEKLMIVGHLPFLQKLVSTLLTGSDDKELVKFTNGSVVFLELGHFGWQMAWLLTPDIIKNGYAK